jgi:3'-phosphoadenosine 5'-phosphosulfate synthase
MEAIAHKDDDSEQRRSRTLCPAELPWYWRYEDAIVVKVMYDITDNVMKIPDETRMQDFISISGTKMRSWPTMVLCHAVPPAFLRI